MAKWTLLSPQRTLVGRLHRVYEPSGWFEDHDTNFVVSPAQEYAALLVNHAGVRNKSGSMELEVQAVFTLQMRHRPEFESWAHGMVDHTVTASGVWVEDDKHDQRTELHPVDIVAAPTEVSLLPGPDWLAKRAADRHLAVGTTLRAYRYIAASDTRRGSFGGLFFEGPPLARTTRTATITLALPQRPGPTWTPFVAHRAGTTENAQVTVDLENSTGTPRARVAVACKAVGSGGPGVALGEIAAYWKDSRIPEIALEPTELKFGQVRQGRMSTKSIRVRNVGAVPLVVSTAGSGSGGVFFWSAINQRVIEPESFHDTQVRFRPNGEGASAGTWHVETNEAIGPRTVSLSGTGLEGLPE
jgi:hypothetical protein